MLDVLVGSLCLATIAVASFLHGVYWAKKIAKVETRLNDLRLLVKLQEPLIDRMCEKVLPDIYDRAMEIKKRELENSETDQ